MQQTEAPHHKGYRHTDIQADGYTANQTDKQTDK